MYIGHWRKTFYGHKSSPYAYGSGELIKANTDRFLFLSHLLVSEVLFSFTEILGAAVALLEVS